MNDWFASCRPALLLAGGRAALLLALALLCAPAAGLALQCRVPTYQPGSAVPSGGSGTDSCHCGIVIQTHQLTCDTEIVYTPPHFTCDGPASETIDCVPGSIGFIELRQQQCSLILASFEIKVVGSSVSITFPVCVGTYCEVTGTTPWSFILSGIPVQCQGRRPRE